MISVPYIAFTASTSTEGMGLPLHTNNMLVIPYVHCEMACFILSVRSFSLPLDTSVGFVMGGK